MSAVRVVIAEDSALLRHGLVRLLTDAGVEVAGEAGDATDLLRKVGAHKPDVAIVDIRMPPGQADEGLRAAEEIGERHPGIAVLVLSQYREPGYALQLLEQRTQGRGYLLKDRVADVATLCDAIERVSRGGCVVDPTLASELLGIARPEDPLAELTDRELDILELMAEGRSNHAIAERLVISAKTVETHVRNIFIKLNLPETADDHRRVLAVLEYLRPGAQG